MRLAWLLLASTTACTSSRVSLFDVTVTAKPVAVGASAVGSLSSRSCDDDFDCEFRDVTIVSMDVTPPGVFDVPQPGTSPASFRIKALAEGEATFTVIGDDGQEMRTFERPLSALALNRITGGPVREEIYSPSAGMEGPCPSPALFTIGQSAKLTYEAYRDDQLLYAVGLVPFVVDGGATIDASIPAELPYMRVRLPQAPAMVSITSPHDLAFSSTIQVVSPQTIDSIAISEPSEPLRALDKALVTFDFLVGGHPLCGDGLTRTLTSLTPTICKIQGPNVQTEWTTQGIRAFEVVGIAAGTCTIRVSLGSSTVAGEKTFTVTN